MLVAVRDDTTAQDLPDEVLATRCDDDLDAFTAGAVAGVVSATGAVYLSARRRHHRGVA